MGIYIAECLERGKPYLLMSGLQFGSAGMYILAKHVLNMGMSQYVFVVYRNAIAAITLAPFALLLERKIRPKMTFRIFAEIMLLGFVEIILDQCFTLLGMKLTSASFTSAVMNSVPSITFLLAVILRMERMKMKEMTCQAKVAGTVVTLGGALLMAMYKGGTVKLMGSANAHAGQPENANDPTASHWLMGAVFVLIACSAFSAFYILQAITLKKYPAEMSLATLICFVGSVQSVGVAAYMERHNPHAWSLGWDLRFFAPAYSGIVTSGIQYYVQGVVMKTMGPVFVTAFNPLRMIIVTVLATFILSEQLYLGSIVGGLVVAVGLYLVVWGKYKEHKDVKAEAVAVALPSLSVKGTSQGNHRHELQLPVTAPTTTISNNNDEEPPLFVVAHQNTIQDSRLSIT